MKVDFVEVSGFRGFRDKARFDFPSGFAVLAGRNGVGKSTVFDAIDFALTGTINKFSVKEARGGGLDKHLWWLGTGTAESHFVTVGFLDQNGSRYVVKRSREHGLEAGNDVLSLLRSDQVPIETLMQTSLIRDELITGLSLDLPEQARFATVRAAIGGIAGPDYGSRTKAVVAAAEEAREAQRKRVDTLQVEIGRTLMTLTEVRSRAQKSVDVNEALLLVESEQVQLPSATSEKIEVVRRLIVQRRQSVKVLETLLNDHRGVTVELNRDSEGKQVEYRAAKDAMELASKAKEDAEKHLAVAVRLDEVEREADTHAAHLAELLEHGSALGLDDGHCPLCRAMRTPLEFDAALAEIKHRLSGRGERLSKSAAAVKAARAGVDAAGKRYADAAFKFAALDILHKGLEQRLRSLEEAYRSLNFEALPPDISKANDVVQRENERILRLERALLMLEASDAVERVKALEAQISTLRERIERERAELFDLDLACDMARQIDSSAVAVANEILAEHFDTVMPLLKELYRRLRPHVDWTDIESDFGGKVRASLNFIVGPGHNPQFMFSSGQRRAAGLAFLLAVHLSRQWCRLDTLMLDDPVQHIDDYRALNLVEVLSAIRRSGRQIIVAVEDEALADVLCRRLRSSIDDIGRRFELGSQTGAACLVGARDVYPMPHEVLQIAQTS